MSAASRKVPGYWRTVWARGVAIFADYVLWHTTTSGKDNIPSSGPVILAGNHSGMWDGPVVLGAGTRGTHFLMKPSLGRGILGWILRLAGQLVVDPNNTRETLDRCKAVLEADRVLGIFPEGGRSNGRVESVQAGVGWLAVHTGAPVVPVACLGTRREGERPGVFPGFRRHIHVSFGPPIALDLDTGQGKRAQVAQALDTIQHELAAHVAEATKATGIQLPHDYGTREPPHGNESSDR